MASRGLASARVAAMEAASGIRRITLALGLGALHAAVRPRAASLVGVFPVQWQKMVGGNVVPAFLAVVVPRTSQRVAQGNSRAETALRAAGCEISLQTVLEIVRHTAGGIVDADAPLMESGADSLGAVELRNQLKSAAGEGAILPSTLVFDHPTARGLADLLTAQVPTSAAPHDRGSARSDVVVSVVGKSAALPAAISSPSALSQFAATASDGLSTVPAARWDIDDWPCDVEVALVSRARHGAFLQNGSVSFDSEAFRIASAEAHAMDPQQRLVLEDGYAALHASGVVRSDLSGSGTGVALGIYAIDFAQILAQSPLARSVYASANSLSIASGRVSFALGLNGPCMSIETVCSASLVACHSAVRALQHNECTSHLAMGVNLMLSQVNSIVMAISGVTSIAGRCHTFDERADGYARGEGASGVVLSHTMAAAVVGLQGSAVRQDGRSASLTAPNGQAQRSLLEAAHAEAGLAEGLLALSEAHGTGTRLGDPIEAGSLAASFDKVGGEHRLAWGGVKACVAHGETTAGTTGLLELTLCLQLGSVAPNAQLRSLNSHVAEALRGITCALSVQQARLRDVGAAGDVPNSGGVSSFGYSGTIARALIACSSDGCRAAPETKVLLVYRRHAFMWYISPHPFVHRVAALSSDGEVFFRSPAAGTMHALVADHIVHNQIIFPGVGYLETARAAGGAALHGVYFLQPLAVESPKLLIECSVHGGHFEVRSSKSGISVESTVHCSGAATERLMAHRMELASVRIASCSASDVAALYDGFDAVGLQYGPGYRTLTQVWGGAANALSRLRTRATLEGTVVHPSDLDDALCTSAVIASGGDGETQLPFAVDDALLQGVHDELWAVRGSCCVPFVSHCPCKVLTSARLCECAGRGGAAGRRYGVGETGWYARAATGAAQWLQVTRVAGSSFYAAAARVRGRVARTRSVQGDG